MASATTYSDELTEERIAEVRAELVETDGEPLETAWHRDEIGLLIESIQWQRQDRTDFYVGGNMFIYYSLTQARERKYKGPDFFFVDKVDGTRDRKYWWLFEEDGRYPDVIVELNSESTKDIDLTTKKDLYERQFKTPEYYCYDPDTQELLGWRLGDRGYQPIEPNEHGWLWSEQLGLWLGTWEGKYFERQRCWLRFFDVSGNIVLCKAEAMDMKAKQEAARAQQEAARAQALEEEVARLKALLAAKEQDNG